MATIEEDIVEILRECENRVDFNDKEDVELQLRAVYHLFDGWSISIAELCNGWEGHIASNHDFKEALNQTYLKLDTFLRSHVG